MHQQGRGREPCSATQCSEGKLTNKTEHLELKRIAVKDGKRELFFLWLQHAVFCFEMLDAGESRQTRTYTKMGVKR